MTVLCDNKMSYWWVALNTIVQAGLGCHGGFSVWMLEFFMSVPDILYTYWVYYVSGAVRWIIHLSIWRHLSLHNISKSSTIISLKLGIQLPNRLFIRMPVHLELWPSQKSNSVSMRYLKVSKVSVWNLVDSLLIGPIRCLYIFGTMTLIFKVIDWWGHKGQILFPHNILYPHAFTRRAFPVRSGWKWGWALLQSMF